MTSLLPPVWKVNTPQEDIRAKRLEDVRFAANLAEVVAGGAPSIYSDPAEFFSKTYPTKALKNLLENVSARLNGENVQSVWRLETFMGGGKTHALIALYHLVKQSSISTKDFPRLKLPANSRVLSIVGTDSDPAAMTLWGEIAYKLGPQAYKTMKTYDESRYTPGVEKLKNILADQPTLILIDEIAHYLEKGAAISYADTTLARQSVVFLRELLDAASQLPQCVIVLTLTSTQEAYGERTQQVLDALREMQQITKRIATVEILTTEEELHGVIKRRLFTRWDEKIAKQVADELRQLYQKVDAVPDSFRSAAYHERMLAGYPFHPELVDILAKRVGSIPQFNRTRGMLRLLARVVRAVWNKQREDAYIILPSDVDLADGDIKAELTKGLEVHDFDTAIAADIATDNASAKSQLLDQSYVEKGLPPVGTQLSNAIYLNTLIIGQKAGVDLGRLLVDVLLPGREMGWYEQALTTMADEFWFLHHTAGLYFFYKEPTLAKIIQDEIGKVNPNDVRGSIYKRSQSLYERGGHFKAITWPEDPQTIPDDESLKLIVLDYRTDSIDPSSKEPSKRAIEFWENSARGPRTYKNTIFPVIADRTRTDRMNKIAREYLAVRNLAESTQTYSSLSDDQKRKLAQKQKQSELDFSICIADTYRFVFVPRNGSLAPVELQPRDIGDIQLESRQNIVYEKLKNHHPPKIVSSLDYEYTFGAAWPKGKGEVSTSALLEHFYQWTNLPIPENVNVLKQTILDGVEHKTWVYYYGQPFLSKQPKPVVVIAPDVFLYTVEEASKQGFCTRSGDPLPKEIQPPLIVAPSSEGEYLEVNDLVSKAVPKLEADIRGRKLTKFSSLQLEFGGQMTDRAAAAILPLLGGSAADIRIQFILKNLPGVVEKDAKIDVDARLKLPAYEKVKQYLYQLADVSSESPVLKLALQWSHDPCDLPTLSKILNGIKEYNISTKLSVFGRR